MADGEIDKDRVREILDAIEEHAERCREGRWENE